MVRRFTAREAVVPKPGIQQSSSAVFTGSSAFADDDGCVYRTARPTPHNNLSGAAVANSAAHHMMIIM
jgi:hypothetical protein